MADSSIVDTLAKGAGFAGAGGAFMATLLIIGQVLRGWLGGGAEAEKALRTSLNDRVKLLEGKMREVEIRLEVMTFDRDGMRFARDRARIERDSARARINTLELRLGETPTIWAPDPPDPPPATPPPPV